MSKVWFITGTSKGFGRDWAIAALERGDQVAATARTVTTLDDLKDRFGDLVLPLALDVNSRENAFDAVSAAEEHFGGLDVVVNNAGYGQFGFAEELSEPDWRDQIETNLFGAVWVTQAALPVLRRRGGGRILQVSSIGGISAFAGLSAYHASKWALEGFSQALAQEVGDFNIKVTLIEPGGFSTDWGGASAKWADPLPVYEDLRQKMIEWRLGVTRFPAIPRRPARWCSSWSTPKIRLCGSFWRRAAGFGDDRLRRSSGDVAPMGALSLEAQGSDSP